MALSSTTLPSPVGTLTLVASDVGLVAVLWPDDRPGRVPLASAVEVPDHPVLLATTAQLAEYFAGERTRFDLPLDPRGTDFQQQVWRALSAIPHGQTRSYAAIAAAIGRPPQCARWAPPMAAIRCRSSCPATGWSARAAR